MEAQRYPADFDGILAGDPGNDRTNLNFGFLWQFLSNHPQGDNSHTILTADDLKLINHTVMEKCDALDGVRDGIITDPRLCHFDPAELRCSAAKSMACLTETQVAALRKMYAGPHRSDTGESIYPGWPVGSEWIEGAGGWQVYWANPQKPDEPQRVDYFRRWAFNDPAWNWWTFDWGHGVDSARAKLGPLVDAVSSDLSAFRAHGGKLVLYQGSADPVVSATDTIAYYDRVNHDNPGTATFARLFMVPGMAHCAGGPGATSFNFGVDADHNAGLALRRWVENGKAPDRLVAVKYKARTPDSGIVLSRPLCAWPKLPAYRGSGDTNDAASFVCR
jgi:feruloyl esterase